MISGTASNPLAIHDVLAYDASSVNAKFYSENNSVEGPEDLGYASPHSLRAISRDVLIH